MTDNSADRTAQLATIEDLTSMSGLDLMRAILAGRFAGPALARTLNFRLESVNEGVVAFRGRPDSAAMNPMGSVHGGWYGALLDSCMGCAVMTKVAKGQIYTTLEYKVNIVRPISLGQEVRGTGRVRHAGRSTGIADGEILGIEDGRIYATGSTTCIIMTPAAT